MPLTSEVLTEFLRSKAQLDEIASDTPLFSSAALDSVSQLDLIMLIEAQAGITIQQADVTLDNMDTVDRILAFVGRQTGQSK